MRNLSGRAHAHAHALSDVDFDPVYELADASPLALVGTGDAGRTTCVMSKSFSFIEFVA